MRLVNRLLSKLGYQVVRASGAWPVFVDAEFRACYERHRSETRLPWQVLYDAYNAVHYVVEAGVPGDIVECGVWRGGCSLLMAETLIAAGVTDRRVFMYDTYEGMVRPSDEDTKIGTGGKASDKFEAMAMWQYAPIEEVERNVARSLYPREQFVLVKGPVEDTIPATMPEAIALLRLDTDFYESTKHELVHLFPRLSAGGVLIVDDYGAWAGSRKAVQEYLAATEQRMLLYQNTSYGSVTSVKR